MAPGNWTLTCFEGEPWEATGLKVKWKSRSRRKGSERSGAICAKGHGFRRL